MVTMKPPSNVDGRVYDANRPDGGGGSLHWLVGRLVGLMELQKYIIINYVTLNCIYHMSLSFYT